MVEGMQHYSRGQWTQIISRARKTNFMFDSKYRACVICGFHFDNCSHGLAEVREVLVEAKRRSEVANAT